jgi:transposase-like protein
VPRPENDPIKEETKKQVLKFYRKGKGYREIARLTGIPHPQSVKHIILYANKK